MKDLLFKILYTGIVLLCGATVITLTTNLANEKDDILSAIGILATLANVLLMIFIINKLWLNKKTKQKTDEQHD